MVGSSGGKKVWTTTRGATKVGTVNIAEFGYMAHADTSFKRDLRVRKASIKLSKNRLLFSLGEDFRHAGRVGWGIWRVGRCLNIPRSATDITHDIMIASFGDVMPRHSIIMMLPQNPS